MTQARKTSGILVLAAAVAAGALLVHRAGPRSPMAVAAKPDASARGAGLSLRAVLQSKHILRGTHDTFVAVTIDAPEDIITRAAARPALNLAIVVDRSGSMAGQKLTHAKQAAKQLLTQLMPGDRFAVVSYGSSVDVVFGSQPVSPASRAAASLAIDGIYDSGGTNLSGGLSAGSQQLLAHPALSAISRVVLISDGMANEGLIGRDELARLAADTAERGISVTTVGVGLDFDERTMTRIAVAGRGSYYFVESANVLAQMFSDELDKLGATVATQTQLSFEPGRGVEVVEALGYPMHRVGGNALIPIADLHAGERRKVVLRLRVNSGDASAVDLGTFSTHFQSVASGTAQTISVGASAEVTDRIEVVHASQNRSAALPIERALTAKAIDDATLLYEQGEAEEARRVLQHRSAAAAKSAEGTGYAAEVNADIGAATDEALGNLRARPASAKGKRGSKVNRAQAYDLYQN